VSNGFAAAPIPTSAISWTPNFAAVCEFVVKFACAMLDVAEASGSLLWST
jgi:hypothetical protein